MQGKLYLAAIRVMANYLVRMSTQAYLLVYGWIFEIHDISDELLTAIYDDSGN